MQGDTQDLPLERRPLRGGKLGGGIRDLGDELADDRLYSGLEDGFRDGDEGSRGHDKGIKMEQTPRQNNARHAGGTEAEVGHLKGLPGQQIA